MIRYGGYQIFVAKVLHSFPLQPLSINTGEITSFVEHHLPFWGIHFHLHIANGSFGSGYEPDFIDNI